MLPAQQLLPFDVVDASSRLGAEETPTVFVFGQLGSTKTNQLDEQLAAAGVPFGRVHLDQLGESRSAELEGFWRRLGKKPGSVELPVVIVGGVDAASEQVLEDPPLAAVTDAEEQAAQAIQESKDRSSGRERKVLVEGLPSPLPDADDLRACFTEHLERAYHDELLARREELHAMRARPQYASHTAERRGDLAETEPDVALVDKQTEERQQAADAAKAELAATQLVEVAEAAEAAKAAEAARAAEEAAAAAESVDLTWTDGRRRRTEAEKRSVRERAAAETQAARSRLESEHASQRTGLAARLEREAQAQAAQHLRSEAQALVAKHGALECEVQMREPPVAVLTWQDEVGALTPPRARPGALAAGLARCAPPSLSPSPVRFYAASSTKMPA